MKKNLVLLCAVLILGIAGCGGDEEDSSTPAANAAPSSAGEPAEPAEPEGPVFRTTMMGMEMTQPLVARDLTEAELPGLTLVAPENAQLRTTSWGSHTVTSAGVNYSVSIAEATFDAASSRTTFEAVDPNGSVIEEGDDQLIYRRSGDNGSFLFSVGVTVGETEYTCGTSATAFPFTRDQVDQMITSCRTLAAAE